ncbi:repeat protein [Histomonas meleagridis]|uniref:repeat protein n=1 Tax=Histomonas meleagridis TaxID=135588 RepID=UPI00355A5D4E|nr:repeat protein [Histomonas meleagridis]KAH0802198.1 repeat protein [Histomonas meleagridis]
MNEDTASINQELHLDEGLELEDDYEKCSPKTQKYVIAGVTIAVVVIMLIVLMVVLIPSNDKPISNDTNQTNSIAPNQTSLIPTETNQPTMPTPTNPPVPTEPLPTDLSYITLDANAGSGKQIKKAYVPGQIFDELTHDFYREGYKFNAWCFSSSCESKVLFPYKFNGNVTLYANWTKADYKNITISFHPLGGIGTMNPLHCTSDTLIQSIPNGYRRTQYYFSGWCADPGLPIPVVFPRKFTEDITLYPRWDLLSSADGKITFESNGGNGTTLPMVCSFNQPVQEILNTFTPPSNEYYFDGFSEKDSKPKLLSNEVKKVTFPYNFTRNVTFLPIWTKYVYHTVTFHFNDGKPQNKSQSYLNGTEVTEFTKPTRENYLFAGWFTSEDLKDDKRIIFPIQITKSFDVYAKWIDYKVVGTITFDSNGGFGTMQQQSFPYGVIINEFISTFHNTGYDFNGWYLTPECTPESLLKFPFVFKQSMTVYASWKLNIPEGKCLVVYDLNGEEGKIEGQLGTIGDNNFVYLERPPKLVMSNKKAFIGWSTSKSEKYFLYSYFQQCTLNTWKITNQILCLYAQWSTDYYSITFDPLGGAGNISPLYVDKQLHKNLEVYIPNFTITKPKAQFRGWSTISGRLTQYSPYMPMPKNTINSDITLYGDYIEELIVDGGNSEKYKGQTIWLKGITPPSNESNWVSLKKYPNCKTYPWKHGDDWWNVAKVEPYEGGFDSDMCWAGHASNALHWFCDRNKKYIEKYFELFPDKPKPNISYTDIDKSGIFDDIKKHWINDGNQPVNGYNWFIRGLFEEGGGYFKDVFQDKVIIDVTEGSVSYVTRKEFNEFITNAFEKGIFVGWAVDYGTIAPHALTIYGVKYDDDGWIRKVYFVDSNSKGFPTSDGRFAGMWEGNIIYYDLDIPDTWNRDKEMYPNKKPIAHMKYCFDKWDVVRMLDSFYLGQDVWEEFLQKNQPKK